MSRGTSGEGKFNAELTLYCLNSTIDARNGETKGYKTVLGKGANVLLRLFSPLQSWFDKTWRPGEFELIK